MRSILLFVTLSVISLGLISATAVTRATDLEKKQKAIFRTVEPLKLGRIILKGEYLFVHDDEAMARGEACTYVYKGNAEIRSNLVVSFHCLPIIRPVVVTFTVRTVLVENGLCELHEYQFAGDNEAHVVPAEEPPTATLGAISSVP